MKHLIAGFIVASILSLGTLHAQQSKFLIEFGGAFNQTKIGSDERLNIDRTNSSSSLHGQFGIAVGKKSFVGLRYGYETGKQRANFTNISDGYMSSSTNNTTQKLHAFGAFYRYYFLPFNKSRFNAFLEIDPSFQKTKMETTVTSSMSYINPDSPNEGSSYFSQDYAESSYNAWDLDLKVGASYRVYKNFHAQLSISSLANVNYAPNNSGVLSEELSSTTVSLFTDPLSNTHLSLLFAF